MKLKLCLVGFMGGLFLASFHPLVAPASTFGDLYFEAVGLSRAQTVAALIHPRWGWTNGFDAGPSRWEGYLALRLGGDSRTLLSKDRVVATDSYVFSGVGLDYVGLLPGLRLTTQFGYSKDLVETLGRSGVDVRAGWLSYHESTFPGWGAAVHPEFYTEGLYFKRQSNFLMNAQARVFWATYDREKSSGVWQMGPLVTLSLSGDSARVEEQRFMEIQAGGRARYQGPFSVSLAAYAVKGYRYDATTVAGQYADFRILLSGGTAF